MVLYTQLSLGGGYWTELFPAVMVTSIGMGLTFVPVTLLATTNIPHEDAGLASGLFNTSQQVGGALGLAILSTIAASRTSARLDGGAAKAAATLSGYHLAFLVGALLMAAAIVILATLIRRRDVEAINTEEPLPVAA
jgi:MFS family permease